MKLPHVLATKKRLVFLVAVPAVVLATGTGLAAAAFSGHAAAHQRVSAGTYRWAVTGGTSPSGGPASLLPGTPPQVFTFTIRDTGTLSAHFVDSDLSVTVTSHVTGCPASDFVTTIDSNGASGTTIGSGGQFPVTVSVELNTTVTADPCQGASPTVTLTIDSTD